MQQIGSNRLWHSLSILSAIVVLSSLLVGHRNVELALSTEGRERISLPFAEKCRKGHTRSFSGILTSTDSLQFIRITAKDWLQSVEIDGKEIYHVPNALEGLRSDRCQPMTVSLPQAERDQQIRITVESASTDLFLNVREAQSASPYIGFFFVGSFIWYFITRRILFGAPALFLGVVSIGAACLYIPATDEWTRQNDAGGHRDYLMFVNEIHRLPSVKHSWESYQPPLYYVLAVAAHKLLSTICGTPTFTNAQWLAGLVYVTASLSAVLLAMRSGLSFAGAFTWAAAFALMPIHIYQAGAVNNDSLMALWGCAVPVATLYAVRSEARTPYTLLGIASLLAIMTKMSTLPLLAAAGLTLLRYGKFKGTTDFAIKSLFAFGFTGVWLVFWFLRTHSQTGELLYVNDALPQNLRVENTFLRFFTFNLSALMTGNDLYAAGVKDSFWTGIYVGMIGGDYSFPFLPSWVIPSLRLLLMPWVLLFAYGLFRAISVGGERNGLFCSVLLYHGAFMILYNIMHPFSCNLNARLWLPALLSICYFIALGAEAIIAKGWVMSGVLVSGNVLILAAVLGFLVNL